MALSVIKQGLSILGDVDDTPVDGATKKGISSNWAYDHEADLTPHLAEALPLLLGKCNLLVVPTNAGWTSEVVGSGDTSQTIERIAMSTGTTANSSAKLHTVLGGLNQGLADYSGMTWDKKLYIKVDLARVTYNSEAVARLQLKAVGTIGELADKGVGIRIDNIALKGESYGTALGVVDLAVTLTNARTKQIVIVLDPSIPKVEWWIDEVLKGSQTTSANIPSGTTASNIYLVFSILNGVTAAGADATVHNPTIWQAR